MLLSIIFLIVFFLPDPSACCPNPAVVFISSPKNVEALSGSCLRIPCMFYPKDDGTFTGTEASFGVWIKNQPKFKENPQDVIFNSSGAVNTYQMEMIGNLIQKNCTTLFHSLTTEHTGTYYFRVESKNFTATASCNPVQINVNDSLQKPRINILGNLKDLRENQLVTVSCTASTPCPHSPPELTWNLQKDSPRHTEENTDGSLTTKIQQTVTLSHTDDGYSITCSAKYPIDGGKHAKTSETQRTLCVSYSPKNTLASISPSGLVPAGSQVELSCSSTGKPSISNFTWFKISTFKEEKVATGAIYSFNVTEGGFYYCLAENKIGSQKSARIYLDNGETNHFSSLGAAVGVVAGILFLICMFFLFRWFKTKQTSHHNQNLDVQEFDKMPEKSDVHYGEIDFSKLKFSSDLVRTNPQSEEVVYSRCLKQNDIYAQVKRK